MTTTTARNSLVGMMNEVRFYSDEVQAADLYAALSLACNAPCPSCPSTISPLCLEYQNPAYIANWDLTQPAYITNIPDTGPNGLDLVLIDDQKLYDPIFVDNQGLYFDGTSHVRTTGAWTQLTTSSFTIDGWIRPSSTTLTGTLFSMESAPNVNDFSVSFKNNNFVIDILGTTATIPFTSYSIADVNTWQYFGVSVQKIGPAQSKA